MLTQIRVDNRINGLLGRPGGAGKRPAVIHLHELAGPSEQRMNVRPFPELRPPGTLPARHLPVALEIVARQLGLELGEGSLL